MEVYHDLLKNILANGHDRDSRSGMTRSIFAPQLRFDVTQGFPAITTKKLAFRSMAIELLWFISGYSDNRELNRLGCHIWDGNANAEYWSPKARHEGDLGRIYGVQWRDWINSRGESLDQLSDVIERIRNAPYDRRHIVTAWNPGEFDQMALSPCHAFFQFFVAGDKLSLQMYQRSSDVFLGLPFNIASYALLLHIVAQITELVPSELILTLGDAHMYHNHFDAVTEQLTRSPYPLPTLWLSKDIQSLQDLDTKKLSTPNDLYSICKLKDYQCHPRIKAPMAVGGAYYQNKSRDNV